MKNKFQKFVVLLLLVAFTAVMIPQPAHADIWGESIMAAMTYKQILEETYNKLQQTIVATLKTAAIQMVLMQTNRLINGPGMGPIGDFRTFIYNSANQYAMQMTNSFFSGLSRGGTAYTNSYIISPARQAALSTTVMGPNIQNYVREGRSDMIFQPGWASNPKVAWNVAAQPQNDPGYLYLQGLSQEVNAYNQQSQAKTAEAIAGAGFQSKRSGGTAANPNSGSISTPGSIQKDTVMKANGAPIDRLSMAQTIPDVVVGIVNGVLMQLLQKGLSTTAQAANKATGGSMSPLIGTITQGAGAAGTTVIRAGDTTLYNAIQQGLK